MKALPDTWATEGLLQGAVAKLLDAVLDPAHARWTHIPSGGKRSKITAWHLKRQGVKRGWPDCIILYMGRVLFIELKRTKRGSTTDAQDEFAAWANLNGFPTVVCRSLGGVEKALREYGVPLRADIASGEAGRAAA